MSEIDVAKYAGHTPGPWQAKNAYEWGEIIGNIDGPDAGNFHYTNICQVDPHDTRTLEHLANARLIAAAPDLLEALTAERTAKEAALAEVERQIEGRALDEMHARWKLEACQQRCDRIGAELRKVREDAERYRLIADATPCALYITRNDEHAINYTNASNWIDEFPDDFKDDAPEEVERMKATNTIWTVQVYPKTPVGFCVAHGSTLDYAIVKLRTLLRGCGEAE